MSGKLMLDVSSRRGDVNLFFLVDVLTKLHHRKGSVHDVYKESKHPLHERNGGCYFFHYIYIYTYSLSHQTG